MTKKTNRDDALRFAWGAITLAAEDIALAMKKADGETQATLERVFDLVSSAQQMAESLYLNQAASPEVVSGDSETVYLAIPKDLEKEIRDAIAILTSSAQAENTLEAASDEVKSLLALCGRGRSLGVGAYAVIRRLRERADRLAELSKSAMGKRQIDTISESELAQIREDVRAEFDEKLMKASERIIELRDMVRAKIYE
ncbi:hypothetical protein SH449x_000951 [Pirellulaceae bacterium SH449]